MGKGLHRGCTTDPSVLDIYLLAGVLTSWGTGLRDPVPHPKLLISSLMSYQRWFWREQVSVKVVDISHEGKPDRGRLPLSLTSYTPSSGVPCFLFSFSRDTFLLVATSRCSSLPAYSTIWLWERTWDGGVVERGAQHHLCFPVLWVGVTPHRESKGSGGNPPRSRVFPGGHALFFCLLSSYLVICSRNSLSSGFGKPGVENLEISTWGEALDSIWD